MKVLGLDIGTTTVSAVVWEAGQVLSSLTLKNGAFLPAEHSWQRLQDPAYIEKTALGAVDTLLARHSDVARIGVTGQMHGILYLDSTGTPVSPLYTWQDGRGDLPHPQGGTWSQALSRITGYHCATGFGTVTHFYNQANGLVPETAAVICTIHDYIAMRLSGRTRPVTEASDAASMGVFHVEKGEFDIAALEKAGIDPAILPQVWRLGSIGDYRGCQVYAGIGDNQASFWGATQGNREAMLVNMGTGSQFCVYTPRYLSCPGLETRPYPGGGYLLVGASLCGGRAYALLEEFFRQTVKAVTGAAPESCYGAMDALLCRMEQPEDPPVVTPLFEGTREAPSLRGSVENLSAANFTPGHLAYAMLEGMARELAKMYRSYLTVGENPKVLIGAGNGLRKNRHLQQSVCRQFGKTLEMSSCVEEAATGAAMYAAEQ